MTEPVPEVQEGVGAPDGFRRLWTRPAETGSLPA